MSRGVALTPLPCSTAPFRRPRRAGRIDRGTPKRHCLNHDRPSILPVRPRRSRLRARAGPFPGGPPAGGPGADVLARLRPEAPQGQARRYGLLRRRYPARRLRGDGRHEPGGGARRIRRVPVEDQVGALPGAGRRTGDERRAGDRGDVGRALPGSPGARRRCGHAPAGPRRGAGGPGRPRRHRGGRRDSRDRRRAGVASGPPGPHRPQRGHAVVAHRAPRRAVGGSARDARRAGGLGPSSASASGPPRCASSSPASSRRSG